jgi:hypothetical protein
MARRKPHRSDFGRMHLHPPTHATVSSFSPLQYRIYRQCYHCSIRPSRFQTVPFRCPCTPLIRRMPISRARHTKELLFAEDGHATMCISQTTFHCKMLPVSDEVARSRGASSRCASHSDNTAPRVACFGTCSATEQQGTARGHIGVRTL